MKMRNILLASSVLAMVVASGCDSNNDDILISVKSTEPIQNQSSRSNNYDSNYLVWEFVHSMSYSYYLWNSNVPLVVDYTQYDTPFDLFESFRHTDDRFSVVLDNYTETLSSFSNTYTTDGINYNLYRDKNNSNNIIAVVEYVYDNTPAQKAGIKRGYVIHKVNDIQLTESNYRELLNLSSCTYTYSVISVDTNDGEPVYSYGDNLQTSPEVTKAEMEIDPILNVSTIVKGDKRIGYFLYDSFTDDTKCLMEVAEKLASQQITDLVLDLRLNGGGYINTLDTLASLLVPDGHVGDLFIKEVYNDNLSEYLRRTEGNDYNKHYFLDLPVKLNINNLYVLTSGNTASASEETISGLMPYMPITLIGNTTYGKFTGNTLINDQDDEGTDENGIQYSEWALYLCVSSCKNSLNEMNFKNGFTPDYKVAEDYTYELGNENEPLLAKAIELCTGTIAKSTVTHPAPLSGYIGAYGKPEIMRSLITQRSLKKLF
jgi:C-terminal processing protease CtpA/Prc